MLPHICEPYSVKYSFRLGKNVIFKGVLISRTVFILKDIWLDNISNQLSYTDTWIGKYAA